MQESQPTVSPGPFTLKGIDVSHFEPTIDWPKVAADGNAFAFAKASDGAGALDHAFASHRAEAKAAGLVFGAYHFFRFATERSPKAQATLFMQAVGSVLPGELPPTVDVECDNYSTKYKDGAQMDADAANQVVEFLNELERLCGMVPMIYTAASFFTGFPAIERFSRYPLWVAHYRVPAPKLPAAWTKWTFWQFTDKGDTPGAGMVDCNRFNGATGDLAALTKKA